MNWAGRGWLPGHRDGDIGQEGGFPVVFDLDGQRDAPLFSYHQRGCRTAQTDSISFETNTVALCNS